MKLFIIALLISTALCLALAKRIWLNPVSPLRNSKSTFKSSLTSTSTGEDDEGNKREPKVLLNVKGQIKRRFSSIINVKCPVVETMMEEIIVQGGNKLSGNVKIHGAKNAILPFLAASMLAKEGITTLHNVPILSDVLTMNDLLHQLNVRVDFNRVKNQIILDASQKIEIEAPAEYANKLRASVLTMGPLLVRNGRTRVILPGGCNIGERPLDLHLNGFRALGAKIVEENKIKYVYADELIGNNITLDYPSIGATQNILMAALQAKGTTLITNAAREPEIVELANFCIMMGARIYGAGTSTIRIEGVKDLFGVTYTIVQDRIEAGTFMIAAAMTQGNVLIEQAIPEHHHSLIAKLREMGSKIFEETNGIRVVGPEFILPTNIQTKPYPGFSTDLQALMTAIMSVAEGTSVVQETVFEDRFQHVDELRRMNALVNINGNEAVLCGRNELQGAVVYAPDLRSVAALVLAGLRANGLTRVRNLKYLDRGYYKFHEKLLKLGAKISRVQIFTDIGRRL